MKHNTIELLHLDAIKRATRDTLFKVQDSLEYPLCYTHAGVTEKIAVEFGNWIAQVGAYPCITTPNKGLYVLDARDPKNYTSEELFQEFLKTKQ